MKEAPRKFTAVGLSAAFCAGAGIGAAAHVFAVGAGTLVSTTFLMLSWKLFASVAGAQVADEHSYGTIALSSVLHGLVVMTSYAVVAYKLPRGRSRSWLLVLMSLLYCLLLLSWPLADGP